MQGLLEAKTYALVVRPEEGVGGQIEAALEEEHAQGDSGEVGGGPSEHQVVQGLHFVEFFGMF